jgi:hypothetical protein
VRRAEGLTVPAKKFGIAAARTARNEEDREALANELKTLLQNLATNQAALQTKGQQPADTQQLQGLHDALVASSTGHGSNTSTQRCLTQANVETVNALEKLMQHLFDDGKALYERSDPDRQKDYTYRQVLKQVRRTAPGDVQA